MPQSGRSGGRLRAEPEGRKRRLDLLVEERGLVRSRAQAQREIRAGKVLVDGAPVDKPGALVREGVEIELLPGPKYVSRGGLKLEHALRAFAIDVQGKVALDIGASTGGFTDCLLQHGASRVYAVDVGRGQLAWPLRQDERVVVLERLNARYLQPEDIGEPVDLATIDASFISLKKLLPPLPPIVKEGGAIIPLVKPQFEAGKDRVRRGVVHDPRVQLEVLEDLRQFITAELGLSVLNATFSPLKGPEGNIEFFLHLVNSRGLPAGADLEGVVEAAHSALDG
ncbi:MAG: TlyA family RNA methyltransferase [Candidatus Acetothermia bacterium]|jgi:23S rRNA (cytidine1920-2'-O)/16S rRNA (cytidine1409-2'-O)-methyltransferase|nr:TlyA family RNA methyltransferase [Candidatus Acetothermia bacterium]MDH7505061.1 TlyA family RNA methyltransferase [Candidatus Acetothermia bacterium]